jgi:Protein of unknown function (DUF2752)
VSPTGAASRGTAGTLAVASLLTFATCALLLTLGPELMDAARDAHARLDPSSGSSRACSFRARTGFPCVGCGGTRAFAAMARGQLGMAFARNPLGAAAALGLWLLLLCSLLSLMTGQAAWLTWAALSLGILSPPLVVLETIRWACSLPARTLF